MGKGLISTSTSLNRISDFLFPFLIEPERWSNPVHRNREKKQGAYTYHEMYMFLGGTKRWRRQSSKNVFRIKDDDSVPPNIVPRACERGLLCSTQLENGENSAPVGQNVARLGLMLDSLEKLVNRLSHGNRGEFTSIIRCSSDTAKLKITLNVAGEWIKSRGSRFRAW